MKVSLRNSVDLQAESLQGWLLPGKTYVVLSVEQYSSDQIGLRIASEDRGQPVVFRASLFDMVDSRLPRCWQALAVRPNAVELGPVAFGQAGFWEKCFERDPETLDEYRRAKEQVMADS